MRILITGGSGFLGRALTRHWQAEHTVCVYSRSEVAQSELAPHENVRKFIGDVRDRDRLKRAMSGCDVVIHAAALKRIEVGQYNPDEMVKTNVLGTMNVIDCAHDMGVKRVIFTSTDKAWRPISPYGQSKAIAEALVLAANRYAGGPSFGVTRYGNVMGSTGSVIPRWRAAGNGTVVNLTDPEATRFWMSIEEAVQLVVNAVNHTGTQHLFIPWLPAFRLGDLAQAMGVEYKITGLPDWEKKHEGLTQFNRSEIARRMTIEEIKQRLQEVV